MMFSPPFRWNLTNRAHLGSLVGGQPANTYPEFYEQLVRCCARVLAYGGDCDWIFVGRSPESIFDYLSGLLFDTSWFGRLELLQFSMRFQDQAKIRQEHPERFEAMRCYLQELKLGPAELISRSRPVALIDLVYSGDTFGRLINFLHSWAREIQTDWNAVKRKIRLIGITIRTKNSPNTWRWQQHVTWAELLESRSIKNVSVPGTFWRYLGNDQSKVTLSYTPLRWGSPQAAEPTYTESQLEGLRLACELFESGKLKAQRETFAAALAKESAMQDRWFRGLVQELRS